MKNVCVYPFNDYRLYLMHHGILGMKWGIRNGPPYPVSRSAKDIYAKAVKHEPAITNDVTESAKAAGSKMYGLENRLKTKDSIERKQKLGREINDAVRYTTIASENDFVKNYMSFKKQMQKKGYTETRCKNYFEDYRLGKVKHKSVQCNYQTKDGYTFEVQFHTKASQDAKTKKIPLYEEVRKPGVSEARKAEIVRQMEELAKNVKDPKDISRIKSHH